VRPFCSWAPTSPGASRIERTSYSLAITRSTTSSKPYKTSKSLQPEQQARLDEHLVYISNNKDRMRYSRLRSVGLPIGSGVTESAAKNVINMRAKRSGQRWSVEGLQGVLTLRAQLKSDRLPAFWKVLSRRYVANVNNVAHAA
jgi:hypothetical protein